MTRKTIQIVALQSLDRTGSLHEILTPDDLTPLGLISRLEYTLGRFEAEIAEQKRRLAEAERQLPGYEARVGEEFEFQAELDAKRDELRALNEALAKTGDEGIALAA